MKNEFDGNCMHKLATMKDDAWLQVNVMRELQGFDSLRMFRVDVTKWQTYDSGTLGTSEYLVCASYDGDKLRISQILQPKRNELLVKTLLEGLPIGGLADWLIGVNTSSDKRHTAGLRQALMSDFRRAIQAALDHKFATV